ncbi:S41 family peptidase [Erythrobacter sp. HL-111]|uniref:S41 family peptidase n=1 Tax=Erythrobacter sp. HL-111 TaxID=1798193 RepID=UPI0006DBC1A0|nr:S41 family peptidase [Erythrobacter sp. HL-111]KPP82429.1 MAG: Periplasmic protease [Erythrobacteraceae bacterium HL-111]SDS42570.1 Peptidase family S41 [Erythrobacter sp. HL-111]
MKPGRTALSVTLALALAACGGGGSRSNAPPVAGEPTPAPTPAPTPTTASCPVSDRIAFAEDVLDDWYLFPEFLDNTVDPADFTDVQDYLNARVAPARAQGIDRFFTFATSIAEENALINSGSSAGFGIRLAYDEGADRVFVIEAFENGNGFDAGMDRGTELLAIGTSAGNLQTVASLMASGGPNAVIDALGPSTPGLERVIRFRTVEGAEIERSIAKTEFSLDPVSDRYGVEIITDGAKKIGYLNLRTFSVGNADRQIEDAFERFAAEGITEFVIDLRYNSGGLVRIADLMGDFLRGPNTGKVFSETVWRDSQSQRNSTRLFEATASFQIPGQFDAAGNPRFTDPEPIVSVSPTKIAFIARQGTASASELVINSMIPYLGENVALIGTDTFGKPVGQSGFDLEACDLRVRATTFRTVNAAGESDYYNGLASAMPATCAAGDDISIALGDPREASIRTALDFLAGRTCDPIAANGDGAIAGASAAERRDGAGAGPRLLQPRRPNPAQYEIRGLF